MVEDEYKPVKNIGEFMNQFNKEKRTIKKCRFLFKLTYPIPNKDLVNHGRLYFRDCIFEDEFVLQGHSVKLNFEECKFQNLLYARNAKIAGKTRFRECHFQEVNFRNTKFADLADFWRSTFHKRVIFFKTDFEARAVFSAATFKENVLFTYTSFEKQALFRGTKIIKGLDLSLALIEGALSVFYLKIENYLTLNINDQISPNKVLLDYKNEYEKIYESAVSKDGDIPIENKIETFRLIKNLHKSEENHIQALNYSELEKNALRKQQLNKLVPSIYRNYNILKLFKFNALALLEWFAASFDFLLLILNKCSNNYGKSYFQGIIFTLVIAALCFNWSLVFTDKYEFTWNIDNWVWDLTWKEFDYYIQSIMPTHKFDYLSADNDFSIEKGFYAIDVIGRIFVGYGFYQTVQAFRKFR